ncbi:MAG: DUF4169 family protein [Hyphomicrobium sp.]
MTADIINLRKARKAKARVDKDKQTAQNRVRFGRTKAERECTSLVLNLERSRLDGAKRTMQESDPDDDPNTGTVP